MSGFIKWVIENKEWLFSGLGIVVIGALYALFRELINSKNKTEKVIAPSAPTVSLTNPPMQITPIAFLNKTLEDIINDIESRPPFQRDEAVKHYIGARFRYSGFLFGLYKRENNQIMIVLAPKGLALRSVRCLVNVNAYPELKVIHEGSEMTVEGKIKDISAGDIYLEEVAILSFPVSTGPENNVVINPQTRFRLIKWIIKNIKWVFSGIGVFILGIPFTIVMIVISQRQSASPRQPVVTTDSIRFSAPNTTELQSGNLSTHSNEHISSLTIDEITNSIVQAPPLQRSTVAKSYVGIKVEWDAYLRVAGKIRDDKVLLILDNRKDPPRKHIECVVSLSEYRELGILPEYSKIKVSGEIESASVMSVSLRNVVLHIYGK